MGGNSRAPKQISRNINHTTAYFPYILLRQTETGYSDDVAHKVVVPIPNPTRWETKGLDRRMH